jgi:hypothetical protein
MSGGKKYVPWYAPVSTPEEAAWRATHGKRYVSANAPELTAGGIANPTNYQHPAIVTTQPSGIQAVAQYNKPGVQIVPDVTSSQTLNKIVFPEFHRGFNGGLTVITLFYQLPAGAPASGLQGHLIFRSPYSSGSPITIPLALPNNGAGGNFGSSCSLQLAAPYSYTNNYATYSITPPLTPLITGCDAKTSLPSDYCRDIRLQINGGVIQLTGVYFVLNGITMCNIQYAGMVPGWSDYFSLTNPWVIYNVSQTFVTQYCATDSAACNGIIRAIQGEFGMAWHPKYTNNLYVPGGSNAPRTDIWWRYGNDQPPNPFLPEPNNWCTTFTAWAIWTALRWSPITDVNKSGSFFWDLQAFVSPMPNYPYRGAQIFYKDLIQVRTGFWADVGDSYHATIFVKWVDNPIDQNEISFPNTKPLRICLHPQHDPHDDVFEDVTGTFFVGVGGNQAPPVCNWAFPVLTLTTEQWSSLPRPWGFLVHCQNYDGSITGHYVIAWDEAAGQYSRAAPDYNDGFGDPRLFSQVGPPVHGVG